MHRTKIALIGGGQIGSVLALMATQKELGNVVILDRPESENNVKGKALDIMTLRPHDGIDVELLGTSDYADIAGADVVIVTAGVPRKPNMTRDDLLNINLDIIRDVAEQVKTHAPNAFVVVATNPVDAMAYTFHKVSGFPKSQVVGLSGALDTGRFQAFIAMETGLSANDVSCMVMGGHGPTMVPLARTATVAGIPITELLSQERIDTIVERTRGAGTEIVHLLGNGSAYFSSAASIMEMVEAHLCDKKRVISSSTLCEGEYGVDGYFIGVPCVIGANGIERVIEAELTEDEQVMFITNFEAVKATTDSTGL